MSEQPEVEKLRLLHDVWRDSIYRKQCGIGFILSFYRTARSNLTGS